MPDATGPLPRGSLAALVEQYAQALVRDHLVAVAPGATGAQRMAAQVALKHATERLTSALDALDPEGRV